MEQKKASLPDPGLASPGGANEKRDKAVEMEERRGSRKDLDILGRAVER